MRLLLNGKMWAHLCKIDDRRQTWEQMDNKTNKWPSRNLWRLWWSLYIESLLQQKRSLVRLDRHTDSSAVFFHKIDSNALKRHTCTHIQVIEKMLDGLFGYLLLLLLSWKLLSRPIYYLHDILKARKPIQRTFVSLFFRFSFLNSSWFYRKVFVTHYETFLDISDTQKHLQNN